ncbi:MAG: exodeoxyribonuclease III [Magnetococcales bacterium]|nr:exodeoxyribonuclease III [Magnetococcales bacterium]
MKIATWNVNSIGVRLEAVLDWLRDNPVTVLGLQETKTPDGTFPRAAFEAAGWQVCCTGQKSYNGMALVSREPLTDILTDLPGVAGDQKRFLTATCNGVRVVNLYVPNGSSIGSDKYVYKLAWLEALASHLRAILPRFPRLVVMGDFNIAPEDRDVHDPAAWEGHIHVSPPERAAFRNLLNLPLADCFRAVDPEPGRYSWWDYRQGSFRRNIGLRIDHVLASPALMERLRGCVIDKQPRGRERPSDHAPVMAEFDL